MQAQVNPQKGAYGYGPELRLIYELYNYLSQDLLSKDIELHICTRRVTWLCPSGYIQARAWSVCSAIHAALLPSYTHRVTSARAVCLLVYAHSAAT